MAGNQVIYQYLSQGAHTLTIPAGYSNQVLVYAWGAGGGKGYAAEGGGGGYAAGILNLNEGDTVLLSIGSSGSAGVYTGGASGGDGNNPTISFNGGSAGYSAPWPGDDNNIGSGGGGGGATAILVNDIPALVASGGGGGSGGQSYQAGTAGLAGGVNSDTTSTSRGGNSGDNYATGGGGGAGYPYGGAAGQSVSDDAGRPSGGDGGQNYANVSLVSESITLAGSGTTPGGVSTPFYPRAKRGYAGYEGAVIIVFTKNFRAWIKDSGNWKSATNTWIKTPSTVVTVAKSPDPIGVTKVFKTLGSHSITVPTYVSSIRITYSTPTGIVTSSVAVTAGDVIPVSIGNFGESSSIGATTIPAYSKQVFSYIGNIDHVKNNVVQIATASGASYSGSGNNGTLTAGAAAVGISYTDGSPGEGWHGDLAATVSITPALLSTMVNAVRVVRSSGSGRQISLQSFDQQPSAANSYIMHDVQMDTSGGEGSYSFTTTLQQQGYIKVDYDIIEPASTLLVATGGWKQVERAWIKDSGGWTPVQTGISLNPVKTAKVPANYINVNITISGNVQNYNLSDYLSATEYFPGRSIINLTVAANIVVSGDTQDGSALIIDGLSDGDRVNLYNNGIIQGRGGDGGDAGTYTVTSGGGCFPINSMVSTPNGLTAIQDIKVGDKVYAYKMTEELNFAVELVEKTVTETFIHSWEEVKETSALLVFTHEYGTFTVTRNHEVLNASVQNPLSDPGFARADELSVDDSLILEDGTLTKILDIKDGPTFDFVYNLEVDDYHTFVIQGLRVHNGTPSVSGKGYGKFGYYYNYYPKGYYGGSGGGSTTSIPGRPGGPGGAGLDVRFANVFLINNGTIAGGGGGGGGGGGATGGQGGGGAGLGVGANNGTLSSAGAGAGYGGAGGARGVDGSSGTSDSSGAGTGGKAGAAIIGYHLLTISNVGTIIGPTVGEDTLGTTYSVPLE